MDWVELKNEAKDNLLMLGTNPYPGRGIIVGMDETGQNLVQVYWIMGRRTKSRNRVFGHDGEGKVFTEVADPSLLTEEEKKDLSLIIYNAMRGSSLMFGRLSYPVSNGHQTDTVVDEVFSKAMDRWSHELDAPNFTSRITAVSLWGITRNNSAPSVKISILRKSSWSDACDRLLYEMNDLGKGFGYCVHTYMGDGDPLPAFRGEPYLLPFVGDVESVANDYWALLNPENKVSLAVKFIPKVGPSQIVIRNKYEKVVWPAD
jgi:hypothetical protein